MTRTFTLLGLLGLAFAGFAQSDLELTLDISDFNNGLQVNKSGVIRLTVTNNGPDTIQQSQGPISISGLYNYVSSDGNPYRFFSGIHSNDADCSLAAEHMDSPPPVNNYGLFMLGTIHKSIPAQSTVICEFSISIRQMASLDMMLQIYPPINISDPNLSNNNQQFTFRGLAASVPVNNIFILMLLISLLLIIAWHYRRGKRLFTRPVN